MSRNKVLGVMWSFVLLVVLAVPAAAGDGVIYNGIDVWQTPGDGSSWENFAQNPIPAGFFCSGAKAFAGRITWQGAPVATSPPGVLGNTDTIIHRLDNAPFDRDGVAATRIRVAALSLVSSAPIKTSCGLFDVSATLRGEQPITEMRIVRTRKGGGYFEAPLELNARLTFTPVDVRSGERLEIDRSIRFLPANGFTWSSRPTETGPLKLRGFVLVDTDGDSRADTFLPGTSNFFPAGRGVGGREVNVKILQDIIACGPGCHTASSSTCHCPEIAQTATQ